MSPFAESDLIALSALQHWAFCPRQCALIHLEAQWSENRLTAEGRLLHEKAHQAGGESRGEVRVERGLPLRSLRLGLTGVADVVEFHRREASSVKPPFLSCSPLEREGKGGPPQPGRPNTWQPFPVEYKRGRLRDREADRLQLCAQGMCLEEMLGLEVPAGALYHGVSHQREEVVFTATLRNRVAEVTGEIRAMLQSGRTPPPRSGPHCRSCSLVQVCLPRQSGQPKRASGYLARQIKANLEEP
ncbi:MAG: CRISPR-associated protein Cas4 [Deltaproteobacteria bacterium]|nr:CRISPR-associated protein Cas4 [Deltaproteobacteria bacterium]